MLTRVQTLAVPQQVPVPISVRTQPPQGVPLPFSPINQGEMTPLGPPPGHNFAEPPRPTTTLPPIPIEDNHGEFPQHHQQPPPPLHHPFPPLVSNAPPQLPYNQPLKDLYPQAAPPHQAPPQMRSFSNETELPPLKPVFGVTLDDLLQRDGSAIPLIVSQCLQAVDLFGLRYEGIYRASGSAVHVSKLRAIFNHGIYAHWKSPQTRL